MTGCDPFKIELAGKVIQIDANFPYLKQYCKEYLVEKPEDFCVQITAEDIDFERQKSVAEDRKEGIPVRGFSDAYLETLAVYRKIAEQMLDRDILLFHGSAIAVDERGYLFTAKSGVGKSTHTRLWREYLDSQAVMINDDKPLLQVTKDGVFVCGTPWNGKHRLSTNKIVPLKAICVLERAEKNQIEQISGKQAYPMLLQQSYRSRDAQKVMMALDLLERITKQVSFYRLRCNMQPEAAKIAYEKMRK